MAMYFVCNGEAAVSSNTVQCSVPITSVDGSVHEPWFKPEDIAVIWQGVLAGVSIILVCWLIKKAIDI